MERHVTVKIKSQIFAVVTAIVSLVMAGLAFWIGRSGLADDLRDAERRAECATGIEAEVDVAELANTIAYDDYVLALGQAPGARTLGEAQADIAAARARLVEVQARRAATLDLCP